MDDIIILLYIGLFMLAIISSMMCHAIGKAQGFKDGFETARRIYKQNKEKGVDNGK